MEARHNHYMDNSYYPDCPRCKINEAAPELLKVSEAVMKWWEEYEYDTTGGEEEYNIYDNEPEMVTLARSAIAEAEKGSE